MKITIPFTNIATINSDGITKTILNVDVCCVPADIPMDCNPRQQNMKSAVVKGIKESLLENDNLFYIYNRGITLTAESIYIEDSNAIVEFNDFETQGCIDGGHTYKSILDCQGLLKPGSQQVNVEILTGSRVTDNFIKLAMARNRSQQVRDESLAELNDDFAWIKEIVKDEKFTIVYRENDVGNVPIKHIIWIMTMLNTRLFPNKSSGAGVRPNDALSNYINSMHKFGVTKENPFYAVKNILLDILKLYDYLEVNFFTINSKNHDKLTCIKPGKFKSRIYRNEMEYATVNQFLYPVLSSFRAIIGVDEETLDLYWKTDPFEFAKDILPELREDQIERYKSSNYTLDACRARLCYENLYDKAFNKMGRIENERIAAEYKAMIEALKKSKN